MKWIHFTPPSGGSRYGWVEGEHIREVRGTPFTAHQPTDTLHRLDAVRIEVPFIPRTFYAAGMNYVRHIQEYAALQGKTITIPERAEVGHRTVNALVAHGDEVVIPEGATQMNYEGELAVVIGRQARHLSREDALSCVLGYTIGNDVSERAWQASDRTFWRCKNADTFKPMGPWIETDFDVAAAHTTVRVNGEVTTHFETADMLFDISTFLHTMTQYITLYPGDVLWMGTDGTSPSLRPGDEVEIEITGLGVLRNRFVAAAPRA